MNIPFPMTTPTPFMVSYRQLQLFDYTPLRDPNIGTADLLFADPTLSAIAASESYLVVAVNKCFLRIASPQLELIRTALVYDYEYQITFARVLHRDILVTLAERQGSPALLKVWDLRRLVSLPQNGDDDESIKHKFISQALISIDTNAHPVSCFQFNADLSMVAVATANGKVVLLRGDLLRDRGTKQRLIYETNDAITAVEFNKLEDIIYVTTTSKVVTVQTTGRNQGKPLRILSASTGVDLGCTAIDEKTQHLIVGTTSSIKYYSHAARFSSFNFEIPKKSILKFGKNYLLMVATGDDETNKNQQLTRVLILDTLNKHIAFNLTIPKCHINFTFILRFEADAAHQTAFLLSSDGVLYKLLEKPINQQIEIILQRELFQIAYNLACQRNLSNSYKHRILKQYADFSYEKQDFEKAIATSIDCLDIYKEELDSSTKNKLDEDEKMAIIDDSEDFIMTTISKFKAISKISFLTKFLVKLYDYKMTRNDHVTLLLCCFCKLKMGDELDDFIQKLDLDEQSDFQELDFPLIINLFKECGYFKQVIKLLLKLKQHSLIVDVLLNDLKRPRECLIYLKTLAIDDLLLILVDYSKKLFEFIPIETTDLLIKVYTGKYMPLPAKLEDPFELPAKVSPTTSQSESTLSYGAVAKDLPSTSYRSLLAYLKGTDESNGDLDDQTLQEPTYLPPRPQLIFPAFIDNPREFVIFLEASIEMFDRYQGNINDKKELLITLLEVYLSLAHDDATEEKEKESWLDRAKDLLTQYHLLLDKASLLLLSTIYEFKEGEIAAQEDSGMEESLFRSACLAGDIEGSLEVMRKYGEKKPELYKLALRFFISEEHVYRKIDRRDFDYVINKIKEHKQMVPLEIVQLVGSVEYTNLELIRDYLLDFIAVQNKEISNNEKLIEYYEQESTRITDQLNELKSNPFLIQNNKCSQCQLKLDYPMVHFKCKHSFHQKCMSDNLIISRNVDPNKKHCPLCVNELDEIKSTRQMQFSIKNNVEKFSAGLEISTDKMKFLADYLGKGAMENDVEQQF